MACFNITLASPSGDAACNHTPVDIIHAGRWRIGNGPQVVDEATSATGRADMGLMNENV